MSTKTKTSSKKNAAARSSLARGSASWGPGVTLAESPHVEGLETWIPQNRSTMYLCSGQTGAFVKIEDYNKLVDKLAKIERATDLTTARRLAILD